MGTGEGAEELGAICFVGSIFHEISPAIEQAVQFTEGVFADGLIRTGFDSLVAQRGLEEDGVGEAGTAFFGFEQF